jgi:hypothetical protein
MSKSTIFKIWIEKLRLILSKQNTKHQNVIFQDIQVLWVIYKLANGVKFFICSELFPIGKFNVSMALHEFIYAMNNTFKKHITMTKGTKMKFVMEDF